MWLQVTHYRLQYLVLGVSDVENSGSGTRELVCCCTLAVCWNTESVQEHSVACFSSIKEGGGKGIKTTLVAS
jgi:hypothetical protein